MISRRRLARKSHCICFPPAQIVYLLPCLPQLVLYTSASVLEHACPLHHSSVDSHCFPGLFSSHRHRSALIARPLSRVISSQVSRLVQRRRVDQLKVSGVGLTAQPSVTAGRPNGDLTADCTSQRGYTSLRWRDVPAVCLTSTKWTALWER